MQIARGHFQRGEHGLARAGVLAMRQQVHRGARPGDGVTASRDLAEIGGKRVAVSGRVRARLRRIEFEQQIARAHARAVLDVDRADLAGIERLHDLGPAGGLHLARRDRVHVEPADEGPGDRGGEEQADRKHERDRQRRGRRLEDLERCGKEFPVATPHLRPGFRSDGTPRSCGRRRRRRRDDLVHAAPLA